MRRYREYLKRTAAAGADAPPREPCRPVQPQQPSPAQPAAAPPKRQRRRCRGHWSTDTADVQPDADKGECADLLLADVLPHRGQPCRFRYDRDLAQGPARLPWWALSDLEPQSGFRYAPLLSATTSPTEPGFVPSGLVSSPANKAIRPVAASPIREPAGQQEPRHEAERPPIEVIDLCESSDDDGMKAPATTTVALARCPGCDIEFPAEASPEQRNQHLAACLAGIMFGNT
ncbi:UBZ4-type domain-containing protein [Plasmodiophora brassicae]|uniref:Uncharacterized protein n=1 Tax=Plasmodiophora brassicae TaxID=37360 RepID=A0A3P3YCX5_PLABS|nr:unnamed protein product [Plasmodiophora brassicae]